MVTIRHCESKIERESGIFLMHGKNCRISYVFFFVLASKHDNIWCDRHYSTVA